MTALSFPILRNAPVVGTQYRSPEAQARARALTPGESLTLRRESGNEYDPLAVAVITSDGHHIGYVQAIYSGAVIMAMHMVQTACVVASVTRSVTIHVAADMGNTDPT